MWKPCTPHCNRGITYCSNFCICIFVAENLWDYYFCIFSYNLVVFVIVPTIFCFIKQTWVFLNYIIFFYRVLHVCKVVYVCQAWEGQSHMREQWLGRCWMTMRVPIASALFLWTGLLSDVPRQVWSETNLFGIFFPPSVVCKPWSNYWSGWNTYLTCFCSLKKSGLYFVLFRLPS